MIIISLQGTVCVKFTPKQYKLLYECGLLYANNKRLITREAVLTSLIRAAREWLRIKDSLTISENTHTKTPNPNDCISVN